MPDIHSRSALVLSSMVRPPTPCSSSTSNSSTGQRCPLASSAKSVRRNLSRVPANTSTSGSMHISLMGINQAPKCAPQVCETSTCFPSRKTSKAISDTQHCAASYSSAPWTVSTSSLLLACLCESVAHPATVRNPHKAVLTIDGNTTEILMCNDMACRLFITTEEQLIGRRFCDLQPDLGKLHEKPMVLDQTFNPHSPDQYLLPVYGKVTEIENMHGTKVPVALWLNHLEGTSNRWLVVYEHVEKLTAQFIVDENALSHSSEYVLYLEFGAAAPAESQMPEKGATSCVSKCDQKLATMFGYFDALDMVGLAVSELIPRLLIDGQSSQRASLSGQSKHGFKFPVDVHVEPMDSTTTEKQTPNHNCGRYCSVTVEAYSTISGLITITKNGVIQCCNDQFTTLMFGYCQAELVGKPVTTILPHFFDDVFTRPESSASVDVSEDAAVTDAILDAISTEWHISDAGSARHSLEDDVFLRDTTTPPAADISGEQLTSTPKTVIDRELTPDCQGTFWGHGLHRDGELIAVGYEIRYVQECGLYCVWILRNSNVQACAIKPHTSICHGNSSDDLLNGYTFLMDDSPLSHGSYAKAYYTLCEIGTGAFGVVKLGARKAGGLLVVTKFIQKNRILKDSWVDSPRGKVPIEVALLSSLSHENIVKVLDVFENDEWYQLVMEKHGSGIDLFEFIDRQPALDEPLSSYIFRQVVAPVRYLYEKGLVHRDIKDENVIIDEQFRCKLIDFGSAAYWATGQTFGTFCGTMEYCSPEVLLGNKYEGPEQEVWSLGVLLYTLLFGENPFTEVSEALRGDLHFPWDVSDGLCHILCWMLHTDPVQRVSLPQLEDHAWLHLPIMPCQYRFDEVLSVCFDHDLKPPTHLSELLAQVQRDDVPNES